MTRIYVLLLSAMISFTSMAQGFSVKKGGNCFTMDIPEYLTRTFDLNDVASLQYQNSSRSVYVIVIEDDKAQLESLGIKFVNARDFLDNFANDFKKDFQDRKQVYLKEFTNSPNKYAQAELYWKEEGSDFYMLITGVETPGHFYKIMCWTPLENKAKVNDDFLRISRSLKD
jgi:hypothetical protein